MQEGFRTTNMAREHSGFQITGRSGYTVSVQFGAGNYCDRRVNGTPNGESSATAEVAVIGPDGQFVNPAEYGLANGDDVAGYVSPANVAAIIKQYVD